MDAQSPRSGRCPINTQSSRSQKSTLNVDDIEKVPAKQMDRRTLLKAGSIGASAAAFAATGAVAWMPKRATAQQTTLTGTAFPDIQFDIGAFVHPATTMAGVPVDFGVIFTFFAPAALTRNPTKADQTTLANALTTIEANYDFSPSGIFTIVSYGVPYFNRLPSSLVASKIPTLTFDSTRSVLEEAVAGPTDFGPQNPGITKLQANFRVPVTIETNDVLFTLRSDSLVNITEVAAWFNGSNILNNNNVPSPAFNGLFNFGPTRLNFVQPGLPRQIANASSQAGLAPFPTIATEINPASSMWMGFVDQQLNGSAPNGKTVTFAGTGPNSSGVGAATLTSAVAGDYFDNGAIQHLSHVLDDLEQFYTKEGSPNFPNGPEPFSERVQYMFHSRLPNGAHAFPFPEDPHDAFTNGGGLGAPTGTLTTQQKSSVLSDFTLGAEAIFDNFDPEVLTQAVNPHKKIRVGHEFALQRSSRAQDGTALHIRNDGPGLSSLDVPDGSTVPTLEFTIFVPTSDFFQAMRVNAASLDLVKEGQNGGTGTSVP
ncbi:MAG: hypothetical protein ABI234_12350, partial [Ktedonobacteraceae bacterium]